MKDENRTAIPECCPLCGVYNAPESDCPLQVVGLSRPCPRGGGDVDPCEAEYAKTLRVVLAELRAYKDMREPEIRISLCGYCKWGVSPSGVNTGHCYHGKSFGAVNFMVYAAQSLMRTAEGSPCGPRGKLWKQRSEPEDEPKTPTEPEHLAEAGHPETPMEPGLEPHLNITDRLRWAAQRVMDHCLGREPRRGLVSIPSKPDDIDRILFAGIAAIQARDEAIEEYRKALIKAAKREIPPNKYKALVKRAEAVERDRHETRLMLELLENAQRICHGTATDSLSGQLLPGNWRDGTDAACPGWWRGHDAGTEGVEKIKRERDALREKAEKLDAAVKAHTALLAELNMESLGEVKPTLDALKAENERLRGLVDSARGVLETRGTERRED